MKLSKSKIFFLLVIFLFFVIGYGYTQYLQKSFVTAVLQYQIDLNNPPDKIFAISTFDQKLPGSKMFPKGARLVGSLSSNEDGYVIYFDKLQISGKNEKFPAKTKLNIKNETTATGVSARISKTFYEETKTNVLGAIFDSSRNQKQLAGSILPRGYVLKVEVE